MSMGPTFFPKVMRAFFLVHNSHRNRPFSRSSALRSSSHHYRRPTNSPSPASPPIFLFFFFFVLHMAVCFLFFIFFLATVVFPPPPTPRPAPHIPFFFTQPSPPVFVQPHTLPRPTHPPPQRGVCDISFLFFLGATFNVSSNAIFQTLPPLLDTFRFCSLFCFLFPFVTLFLCFFLYCVW